MKTDPTTRDRRSEGPTRRAGALGLALLVALAAFGCAFGEIRPDDPFDRRWSLEQAQHRYTVLTRWSQFQKAKMFVAKEERDLYVERMEALEDARFTDYESDPVELDPEKKMATIRVTYTVYFPNSPFEIEVTETQVWTRDGVTNNWQVHSVFEGLPEFAAR